MERFKSITRNSNRVPLFEHGFSLVEIMIAMVIGLIIIGAVVQLFAVNRSTYQVDEGLARIQENARFAIDFISRDLRMAGNTGCVRDAPPINNLNAPANSPYINIAANLAVGLLGFEADTSAPGDTVALASSTPTNTTSGWTPALDTAFVPPGAVPGSDAIVIFRLSGSGTPTVDPHNDSAQVFAQPGSNSKFKKGQLAILTNCIQSSLFQITSVSAGVGKVDLAHAASGTPGNICPTWGQPGCLPGPQDYGPGSEIYGYEVVTYFIAAGASGEPALFQATFQPLDAGNPNANYLSQELVEGIESMQLLYGVDLSAGIPPVSDGDPDDFMTAEEVETGGFWNRVVAVRIGLLLRSSNTTGTATDTIKDTDTYVLAGGDAASGVTLDPFDDFRRRHAFNTTVMLRNRGL
jgi:type IV pilus assembly protein PilW